MLWLETNGPLPLDPTLKSKEEVPLVKVSPVVVVPSETVSVVVKTNGTPSITIVAVRLPSLLMLINTIPEDSTKTPF